MAAKKKTARSELRHRNLAHLFAVDVVGIPLVALVEDVPAPLRGWKLVHCRSLQPRPN